MAFVLNCLGKLPYAGASWMKLRDPSWLSAKVEMVSDWMAVEFEGSRFGTVTELSLRLPMIRKRLSGYRRVAGISIEGQHACVFTTYRDEDFRGRVAFGRRQVAVRAAVVDLLEAEAAAVCFVGHGVPLDGGAQLVHDVQECRAAFAGYAVWVVESCVAWSVTWLDAERVELLKLQSAVVREDADQVSAQIRHEQISACRVEDSFVLVWCFLSAGYRPGLVEREHDVLVQTKVTAAVEMPRAECRASVMC